MKEYPKRLFYLEASSRVNQKILGEQYFKDNKRRQSINTFPTIKNLYVENASLLVLVNQFIDYYKHHKNKTICLFGGSDGTRKNDAISRQSYFSEVEKWLTAVNWKVIPRWKATDLSDAWDNLYYWELYPQVKAVESDPSVDIIINR